MVKTCLLIKEKRISTYPLPHTNEKFRIDIFCYKSICSNRSKVNPEIRLHCLKNHIKFCSDKQMKVRKTYFKVIRNKLVNCQVSNQSIYVDQNFCNMLDDLLELLSQLKSRRMSLHYCSWKP